MAKAKKDTKKVEIPEQTVNESATTLVDNTQVEGKVETEGYVNPEDVISEFSEAGKKIDEFVNANTTQEELEKKLQEELERAGNVEAQLEKQIERLEKDVPEKTLNNFTKYWSGSCDGWFN